MLEGWSTAVQDGVLLGIVSGFYMGISLNRHTLGTSGRDRICTKSIEVPS